MPANVLTDTAIRALKPKSVGDFKVTDGEGLNLLIRSSGGRLWRLSYRFAGKQKTLALGTYPEVGLAAARKLKSEARELLRRNIDPGEVRRRAKGVGLPAFTNAETGSVLGMDDLQRYGRALGNIQSRLDFACYRAGLPPLGLAAVAPFERAWQSGTSWAFPTAQMAAAAKSRRWRSEDFEAILRETYSLSGQAAILWKPELSGHEVSVRDWAFGLKADDDAEPRLEPDAQTSIHVPIVSEAPYWVFVCNPKKWAIDRFIEQRIEHDTWGVNPHHAKRSAPGQLAIVRVGGDQRSAAQRDGRAKLQSGIYALCEVESEASPPQVQTTAFGTMTQFVNLDGPRCASDTCGPTRKNRFPSSV